MELEAAGIQVDGLVFGAPDDFGTGARIHTVEGNQHVVVPCRAGDERGDAVGLVFELGAGVHGEHDGGQIESAVDIGDAVQRRRPALDLKYFADASVRAGGRAPWPSPSTSTWTCMSIASSFAASMPSS